MPDFNNRYGDLEVQAGVYAEKKLLEHAEPVLVLNKLGDTKGLPRNASDNIKWRRPVPFAPATTPLTEGQRPEMKAFTYDKVTVSMDQYGNVTELTDVITDMHESPVGSDMAMMMGENAAETIEAITWGVLQAGTNVEYANGSSRTAVNTPITLPIQRKIVRTLMGNKAKKITQILDGSPKYSTTPVEAAYVAVTHTDCAAQVRKLAGFTPVAEYGSRTVLCPEEIGSVEDVRYICSPDLAPIADAGGTAGAMLSTTGTSADVYPVIFLGQHAFGCVALKGTKAHGGAIKPIVRNPGNPDSNDPLGQLGSVGWKTYYAAVILNDAWMVRLECAVEENPS